MMITTPPWMAKVRMKFADFQLTDPSRTVDWRWLRAQTLVRRGERLSPRNDGEQTRRAAKYMTAKAAGRSPKFLERNFADIMVAEQLAANPLSLMLKARLLAGESFADIAEAQQLSVAAVAAFEGLFFNVSDLLDAKGWITGKVFRSSWCRALEPQRQAFLRLAYAGGSIVLRHAAPRLAPEFHIPSPRDSELVEASASADALLEFFVLDCAPQTPEVIARMNKIARSILGTAPEPSLGSESDVSADRHFDKIASTFIDSLIGGDLLSVVVREPGEATAERRSRVG